MENLSQGWKFWVKDGNFKSRMEISSQRMEVISQRRSKIEGFGKYANFEHITNEKETKDTRHR